MNMPATIYPVISPAILNFAAALKSACEKKRYIEFRYVNQRTYKDTPSRVAAQADTLMVGELDEAKGFLFSADDVFYAKTTGHWCIRLYSMNRKVKGADGYYSERHNRRTGKNFEIKNLLPRTYRLVGINVQTCLIGMGRKGKVRLLETGFQHFPIPQGVDQHGQMVFSNDDPIANLL